MALSLVKIVIAVNFLILPMLLGWIQLYESFRFIVKGGNTALFEIRRQDTAPKEVEILCYAIMSIIEIVIAVNFLILPMFLGWIQLYESFTWIMSERSTALNVLRTQDCPSSQGSELVWLIGKWLPTIFFIVLSE